MTNYIPDLNRFKLAGPPVWWLSKLHEFDDSLVVVPSRQDCVYRLAQRRPLNLPAHVVNDALFNASDTRMLASYSLVPVTSILATANWSNPFLFQELANRAPWRQGGAEQVEKRLLQWEREEEIKTHQAIDQRNTTIAKDGWKVYQAKTGQRRFIDSTKTKAWQRPLTKSKGGILLPS